MSVLRCRFHRPSAIRKALGATDVASNPVADLTSLDETVGPLYFLPNGGVH